MGFSIVNITDLILTTFYINLFSVENLFCRLCKYNNGKRLDTMSRGSYQRRVYITVLQHNEGYRWHQKFMKLFTGEDPGYWWHKMVQERGKSLARTRKNQTSPGFKRRGPNTAHEVEVDYGPAAVEAAEQEVLQADLDNFKQKYAVSCFRHFYL